MLKIGLEPMTIWFSIKYSKPTELFQLSLWKDLNLFVQIMSLTH